MTEQQHPTRQAVLIDYAERYRRRTGVSHEEWGERVDFQYCARVAEKHRTVPAPDLGKVTDGEAWKKLRRSWDQTIRRYVSGEMRFPVELEEAWVLALAEPYRAECIREIAERYGLLGAFQQPATAAGDAEAWASVPESFSRLTRDMAVIMADARIDEQDRPYIPQLRANIRRMQAHLQTLDEQARRVESHKPVRSAS